jgi:hypothetical protein
MPFKLGVISFFFPSEFRGMSPLVAVNHPHEFCQISIVKDYKQMQLTTSINPADYIADSNAANFEFLTQYQDLR